MNSRAWVLSTIVAGLFLSGSAFAHHGKDFVLAETYELPHPGTSAAIFDATWAHDGAGTAAQFEPALLFGLSERWSAEIHAHLDAAPGESASYEATAFAAHYLLKDGDDGGWGMALSGEYEYTRDRNTNDRFEGRFVFGRQSEAFAFSGNLIAAHEFGSEWQYGYAASVRTDPEGEVAWGAEVRAGGIDEYPNELMAGLYLHPVEAWTFKFGLGAGIAGDPSDYLLHASVVMLF